MKKFLSFMVMIVALVLPVLVKADISLNYVCGNQDANGVITCTLVINDTSSEGSDSISITLTEKGGAEIQSIESAADTDWTVSSKAENNGVWTVLVTSPGTTGENNLLTFKYKVSGEEGCGIKVGCTNGVCKVENDTTPTTPSTPDTPTTPTTPDTPTDTTPGKDPDTPTENEETGATLPYIALGAIVLVAIGAYLATRNKSKMYKI